MPFLDFFINYISHVSYFAILLLLVLGSIGIPFPEEIVLLVSGYLASVGILNIWLAITFCFLGVMLGDSIGYFLGHHGGKLLKRLMTRERFRQVEYHFEHHGAKTIFLSRFLSGIRVFFPIAAGATGMKLRTFYTYDTLAALIWVPFITFAGYLFGRNLDKIVFVAKRVDFIIAAVAVVVLVAVVVFSRKRKKLKKKLKKGKDIYD